MSSRDIGFYVVDIFIAIDKIARYTKDFSSAQDLFFSELNWDATIRELEVIGEATKYLLEFGIVGAEYRRVVDFRNQISHGYFGIDENIVWDVVTNKLKIYENDLYMIIKNKSINLYDAIASSEKENAHNQNINLMLKDLVHKLK